MNGTRVGAELVRIRRRAGFTQSELADRMGTKQPAISRAESGRVEPSIEFIDRVVRATGIPLSIRFSAEDQAIDRRTRQRRLKRVMGDYVFNPWDRSPTEAEARSLIEDGLTRDRFEGSPASPARRR